VIVKITWDSWNTVQHAFIGAVDGVGECHLEPRHDAQAGCARLFERAGPNVSSIRARTLSRSIPSVASASASICPADVPARQGVSARRPAPPLDASVWTLRPILA
jgi:hypothetical protein